MASLPGLGQVQRDRPAIAGDTRTGAAPRHRALTLLGGAALLGLVAPLAVFAVTGWFSRYAADDFCTAGQVAAAGFFQAQANLYVGWSGRFAATFLATLLELIGPSAVPLLSGLALLVWLVVAAWSIRQLANAFGHTLPWLASAVLAALVVYATLQTTADLPQILYWQTGLVTYLAPLILATLNAGLLARTDGKPSVTAVVAAFALAFVAGGTSETFAAAQVTAFVLALAAAIATAPRRRALLAALVACLVGSVLALAIVAVAPGNEVRQETPSRTPLIVALPQAIEFTQGWLRLTFARPHAIELALLIGLPAAIAATAASRTPSMTLSQLVARVGPGVAAFGLVILGCMLPAFYAIGSNPPGRAQLIPQYMLVCAIALAGWLLGAPVGQLRPAVAWPLAAIAGPFGASARTMGSIARPPGAIAWPLGAVLVVLLVLGPLVTASQASQHLGAARAYAAAWDQLDADVRAQRRGGVLDVTVAHLTSTGNVQSLDFIGADRGDWLNGCVARFYAVNTIASR